MERQAGCFESRNCIWIVELVEKVGVELGEKSYGTLGLSVLLFPANSKGISSVNIPETMYEVGHSMTLLLTMIMSLALD